jgi:hypothetical protein
MTTEQKKWKKASRLRRIYKQFGAYYAYLGLTVDQFVIDCINKEQSQDHEGLQAAELYHQEMCEKYSGKWDRWLASLGMTNAEFESLTAFHRALICSETCIEFLQMLNGGGFNMGLKLPTHEDEQAFKERMRKLMLKFNFEG